MMAWHTQEHVIKHAQATQHGNPRSSYIVLASKVIEAARELNKDTQTMDSLNNALAALDAEFPKS